MITYLLKGFVILFTSNTVFMLFCGELLGIIIGIIPGLTGTMGIALLIPITYYMPASSGLSLLIGIFSGAIYGGSISAILLRTPGTPAAGATILDGYPLAQSGQAGKAITVSTIASAFGGLISAFLLSFLAPQIAKIAVRFGPPEYVLLGIYGLTMISFVSGRSLIKGLFSGCIGLFLSTIGMDPIRAIPRFTFDNLNLLTGISLLPVLIGIFAFSQALNSVENVNEEPTEQVKLTKLGISLKEFLRILPHIVKSAFIGASVGAVPGTGTDIAAYISYGEAKRSSKYPEEFGHGSIEGIAAPESGNNACVNGAMIPMFTLGIPGEAATAVILGGLMVLGLQPGPLLFTENPQMIYTVFASTITANMFMLLLGVFGARVFAKVLSLPKNFIITLIFVFSILGSYSMANSMFDVMIMMLAGLAGYMFIRLDYPVPPILLGMILGPLVEANFGRTLILFQNDLTVFFKRPISVFFLLIIILTVASTIRKTYKERKNVKS